MSLRSDSYISVKDSASPDAAPGAGGNPIAEFLAQQGLVLNLLPPGVQSRAAGTCLWMHEEALVRIQRFRGSVYEDQQGTEPMDAVKVGSRYTLSCDTQNYHVVLSEPTGPLAASLRFRFYRPGTTASGLKMFEAVRRMPPAQGVHYTSFINATAAEGRGRGQWVVEVSGLAVARRFWNAPAISLLTVTVVSLIKSMAPALIFAQVPASPHGAALFDGFPQQVYGLAHLNTLTLPQEMEALLPAVLSHLLDTHPHLADCQPTDGDDSLPPLFFQQTGSRPGVGTYR